jgi:branched-chain amino acid aminotransferase
VTAYPHVYFAGKWVAAPEATVSIGSLAMRYAISAFEGIRLYRQLDAQSPVRPFLLGEHAERLASSIAVMRLPDPGVAGLPAIIDELIERNGISEDSYVRVAVTAVNPGDLGNAAQSALSVTASPMGRKRWLSDGAGMSLKISDWQRGSAAVFPPSAKNISNYAGPRLAWLAAQDEGYDGCVLRNGAGRLCEAPTAAVFLARGGVLRTPGLGEDVLPSITRAWVIRTCQRIGVPVSEDPVTAADAHAADEAFLCGTGIEFAPIRAFDGRPCRDWPELPLTRTLVLHYFADARVADPGRRAHELDRKAALLEGVAS